MRNLSSKFRHEMYYNHTFDCLAEITLVNNTKLTLTNTELWTSGFAQDDSVSQDNSFTALGAAVIGSASIIINNMDESYSDYDFTNAKVVLSLSKTYTVDGSDIVEPIRMGTYAVDDTAYNGATITLSLLDNMAQFDRPYTTNLSYPATLIDIVEDACLKCGVHLATLTFPHENYEVQTKPDKDNTTYRQVLSWAAAIAGCFARCNAEGRLELKWFDTSLIDSHSEGLDGGEFDSSKPYSTGDTADGGTFNPWNTGYEIDDGSFETVIQLHYLTRLFSQNIGVDDVVITGVRVVTEIVDSTTNQREDKTYLAGTEDYVIELSGNEFITSDTANSVCTWLGNQLIGLRFRNGSVTHINDPSIEAGDVAIVVDRKGREYPFLITHTSFSASGNQTTECNAESASRNSATRFSQATKAYVDARKLLNKEQTIREQAIQDLVDGLASKSGLYSTVETTQSGNIYYLHDKPLLADSKIVWKMTNNAFGVTTDYNGSNPEQTSWNAGLTVDGTLIASIIDTIQISFSRGHGGILKLGGVDNGNGWLLIVDENDNEIGRWTKLGLNVVKGTIKLGDAGNGNPVFQVLNNGAVTADSFTAKNYIYVDGNSNSYFKLPLYSASDYLEISDGGFTIKAWTYDEYTNVYGMNHSTIEFGTSKPDYSRMNKKSAMEITGTKGSIKMSPAYFILTDDSGTYKAEYGINRGGVGAGFTCKSASGIHTSIQPGLAEFDGTFRVHGNYTSFYGNVTVTGDLAVTGAKPRLVNTEDYGNRYLYCYETPTPMFGDIGDGIIGEDGKAYIQLDPTFLETVTTIQYQVFLQRYGEGDLYVKERHESYFIVSGTPGLEFGWEIKARQRDYENYRLEKNLGDKVNTESENYGAMTDKTRKESSIDYGNEAVEHIEEINNERIGITNESSNISNNLE